MKNIKIRLLFLFVLAVSHINAQEGLPLKKLSIRAGSGVYYAPKQPHELQDIGGYLDGSTLKLGFGYNIDVSCLLNKRHDVGLYFNNLKPRAFTYFKGNFQAGSTDYLDYLRTSYSAYFYGLQYCYHIPIFGELNQVRLNLYALSKIGITSEYYSPIAFVKEEDANSEYFVEKESVWDKPFVEASAGIGLGYKFFRGLGIFTELSAGRFHNNQHFRWNTGISFHF